MQSARFNKEVLNQPFPPLPDEVRAARRGADLGCAVAAARPDNNNNNLAQTSHSRRSPNLRCPRERGLRVQRTKCICEVHDDESDFGDSGGGVDVGATTQFPGQECYEKVSGEDTNPRPPT